MFKLKPSLTQLAITFAFCGIQLSTSNTALAQKGISKTTKHILQESVQHKTAHYDLFKVIDYSDREIDEAIHNVTYLKLDKNALALLKQEKAKLISITLPINGTNEKLTCLTTDFFDAQFKIYERGADGIKKPVNIEKGLFYKSAVNTDPGSVGSFSVLNNEIAAIFSTLNDGNFNLVLNYNNPGIDNENYLLFKEKDIVSANPFSCATNDALNIEDIKKGENMERGAFSSCRTFRVALHGDYRLYQRRSSNINSVYNYFGTLFNEISTLYNEESINAVVSEMVVNTAPDGYTYQSSYQVLYKFGEVMHDDTTWVGDIAHMVSGYRQGNWAPLGGLAWLNVLCATPTQYPMDGNLVWTGPYSMSNNNANATLPQVPIYSWDVQASTHELGHNIGSPHTQSCSWQGGAIDDCYTTEGNCNPGPPPINGGTIMSYCHLTSNGINFANGFGPLPGNLIRTRINTQSCLTKGIPSNTVTTASVTRFANRQCKDGSWFYYYYDNNTADMEDDELLLAINPGTQDIANIDTMNFEVSVTTNGNLGSNTTSVVAAPYNTDEWHEINKTWKVNIPANFQPTGEVRIRVPYSAQDFSDLQGSTIGLNNDDQLIVFSFKNEIAANNPISATTADIQTYFYGGTLSHWNLVNSNNYKLAEYTSNHGVFGGSIAYNAKTSSASSLQKTFNKLSIYPNPANQNIFIAALQNNIHQQTNIEVFDNLGRVVLNRSAIFNNGVAQLAIHDLSSGTYFVRVVSGETTYQGRFTKE